MIGSTLRRTAEFIAGEPFPSALEVRRTYAAEKPTMTELDMSVTEARRQWLRRFRAAEGLRNAVKDVVEVKFDDILTGTGCNTVSPGDVCQDAHLGLDEWDPQRQRNEL